HGDDGVGIEAPDNQTLENEANRRHHEWCREHAEPNRQAGAVNEIRGVGAEQNELAMGEVEDAHHAGDDAESQHYEDNDGPAAQDSEGGVQRAFHALTFLVRGLARYSPGQCLLNARTQLRKVGDGFNVQEQTVADVIFDAQTSTARPHAGFERNSSTKLTGRARSYRGLQVGLPPKKPSTIPIL